MSNPMRPLALARRLLALTFAALFAIPVTVAAQAVDISGFLKTSFYYDTRQIAAAREGDFHGASNALLSSFRIRRSFVDFAWDHHEALVGMEWSPTFLETWPRTAATEAGVPYHCFSRLLQARYMYKPDGYRVKLVAAQQRDAFAEISGLKTAQQAGLPMLMAFASIDRKTFQLGGGTWTKWVRPTLTSERFNAMAYQGYLTWSPGPVTIRSKVTYGEDLADQIMTGGFLVEDDGNAVTLKTLAAWAEIETARAQGMNYGVFGGYFTNLGAGETVNDGNAVDTAQVFARGADIESGFRVAPRATYSTGKVRFAFELQIDNATYASGFDEEYAPSGDTDSVMNVRTDFSVFLFF